MALKRTTLRAMGIEEEKIEEIIQAHSETVNALKNERDKYQEECEQYKTEIQKYKNEASKMPELQKELEDLKAETAKENPFEKKYNDLKKEYEQYKTDVTAKETKTAKETAVKKYFDSKNILGKNLDLALRAAKDEISSIELENGEIKDTSVLDKLIEGEFSGLVSVIKTEGAFVPTPPQNIGGGSAFEQKSLSQKMQYANENPDAPEVIKWLNKKGT